MNVQRKENEERMLNQLLNDINTKHGSTQGNSLVAREMVRIYNKLFKREVILIIKKEAALRVLYGQQDRRNPFDSINFNSDD